MKQIVAVCIVLILGSAAVASGAPCESLTSLSRPNTTVTMAQSVAPGAFTQPGGRAGRGGANAFASLPAFCRVAVTLKPTPRSDIKAEVWLPSSGWNGKLQVVGNGSFAGTIGYAAMATALAGGYATASTDTGHTGPAANTFVNEDVLVDYAYRSIHETTAVAKKIVDGFFGSAPTFSYFSGCSTGGRQALHEAQRYPDDFNGIVAGAPGLYASRQAFAQNWMYQATADPASALPREALTLVHDAVLNACDGLDGARDGILENPLVCQFDPQVLTCREGSRASCLTPPQVAAVKKIYAGPSNPRTGEQIFPGFERGSELGWSAGPVGLAADYFKFIVFKDPDWDPKTLDFDAHVALVASRADYQPLDARTADLSAFANGGGKLLMYQGWAENGIPPRNVVNYYSDVKARTAKAADAVRLFMVAGMGHCGGGDGATTFDMVAALDQWVTSGKAPAVIPASRVRPSTNAQGVPSGVDGRDGKADRTRPLCAYPQFAVYKGKGSIDDAASFECRANPTR
jgi:feruloyl esterase